MNVKTLHDKYIIESHFRKNTDLNIYSIGDLDDFFWKYTKWFAIGDGDKIEQIVLLYEGSELPTLLAITDNNIDTMITLIEKIKDKLPGEIYCHLSKGVINAFEKKSILRICGVYYKMSLKEKSLLIKDENKKVKRLLPGDIVIIKALYDASYPDNFFDKRMLETGKYFGYFEKGELIGISGIHVYSDKYRVATLGNITINPAHRGKSICQKLTSALCSDLLQTVDNIGLNVSVKNLSAVNCYKKIGFEIIGEYEEYLIENKID
ncbi:MAG: GNAT family N-acetyltransferase [Bacteroidota bacterium]|nr:GNAT family N-acetyltransferase [Bacteroidota bacterium]